MSDPSGLEDQKSFYAVFAEYQSSQLERGSLLLATGVRRLIPSIAQVSLEQLHLGFFIQREIYLPLIVLHRTRQHPAGPLKGRDISFNNHPRIRCWMLLYLNVNSKGVKH